jgi:lysozyme
MRLARLLSFVFGALLVAAAGAYLWAPHWTPARSAFPIQGIDVSGHQGTIAWGELRRQGVDFAYIKATEGGDFKDKRFLQNWASAGRAGIPRGAYHFFTLCRSGAEQAANFLAIVPNDPEALPPAVDLEFMGNCKKTNRMDRSRLRKELQTFLIVIEARARKPAILYLTEEFDRAYGVSSAFDRPLWLRRLILRPNFGSHSWSLWQVSNFRRLDGISGRVDWNVALSTWPQQPGDP